MKKNLRRAVAAVSAIAIVAASSVPVSAAGILGSSNNCNSNSGSDNCNISIKDCYPYYSDVNSLLRSLLEKFFGNYSCTGRNDCDATTPETGNGADSGSNDSSCDTGDCTATTPDTDNTPSQPDTSAPDDTPAEPDTSAPDDTPTEPDTSAPDDTPSEPDAPVQDDIPSEPDTSTSDDSVSEYEKKVVELVNAERAKYGLPALTLNTELSAVARAKSQDMKDKKYFSHTSPTYGSPFDMMKSFGIKYKTAGENIAMGYRTPEAVVAGWMNSAGHRANILNSSFKEIGVGYVESGHYWTQMFIG